jgi:hypothetical protein
MIPIRELLKNLALLIPTRLFETLINYSVLYTPDLNLVPNDVRVTSKKDYFGEVNRKLDAERPIWFLEFGAYKGKSIRQWCRLNSHPDSLFVGFDSFVGLPEKWRQRPRGYLSTEGKVPQVEDTRVEFVKGWFNRTLSQWMKTHQKPTSATPVVHIDSDLYSSAIYVLTRLHDFFSQYYVLLDNYGAGEGRALRDYLIAYNADFQPIMGRKRRSYSRIPGQVFGIIATNPQSESESDAGQQEIEPA